MAEWRTEWRIVRKNGRMVEWREGLPTYYFMVHANDDTNDDDDDDT